MGVAKGRQKTLLKKRNILFDLDGTLTDPMVGITKSVHYALAHFGIEVAALEELTPFIGPPLKGSFQHFYGFSEEDAETALQKYREYFSKTGLFENQVYEGIPSLLKALKEQNFRLYVATSKPTVYATQILEHFQLAKYFDFIGGSLLSGERVEKKDVIDYVLKEKQIDPENAIMVGDRSFDVTAGRAAGLTTIGVLYGYGDRNELTCAGAAYLAETVEDLKTLLLS